MGLLAEEGMHGICAEETVAEGCLESMYSGWSSELGLRPGCKGQAGGDRMQRCVCRVRGGAEAGKPEVGGGAAGCDERVGYWNSRFQRWGSFS